MTNWTRVRYSDKVLKAAVILLAELLRDALTPARGNNTGYMVSPAPAEL
jgi:hypothetical protein